MYLFKYADSQKDRQEAFNLRYDVYCREKSWLAHEDYPDKQEIDNNDSRSVIFLALEADTKTPVGTVRLIINESDHLPLPIVKHPSINGALQTAKSVEISRMSILPTARKGSIFIGLIRMLTRHILEYHSDYNYIFFSVEQRFLDKVNLLGYNFTPVAPAALWYCDQLVPAKQIISNMEKDLSSNNPAFYAWLSKDSAITSSEENLIYFVRTNTKNKK